MPAELLDLALFALVAVGLIVVVTATLAIGRRPRGWTSARSLPLGRPRVPERLAAIVDASVGALVVRRPRGLLGAPSPRPSDGVGVEGVAPVTVVETHSAVQPLPRSP